MIGIIVKMLEFNWMNEITKVNNKLKDGLVLSLPFTLNSLFPVSEQRGLN